MGFNPDIGMFMLTRALAEKTEKEPTTRPAGNNKWPSLASDATPVHSLRSAGSTGKKSSSSGAVADNMVKQSLGCRSEVPSGWNVERMRSVGAS